MAAPIAGAAAGHTMLIAAPLAIANSLDVTTFTMGRVALATPRAPFFTVRDTFFASLPMSEKKPSKSSSPKDSSCGIGPIIVARPIVVSIMSLHPFSGGFPLSRSTRVGLEHGSLQQVRAMLALGGLNFLPSPGGVARWLRNDVELGRRARGFRAVLAVEHALIDPLVSRQFLERLDP